MHSPGVAGDLQAAEAPDACGRIGLKGSGKAFSSPARNCAMPQSCAKRPFWVAHRRGRPLRTKPVYAGRLSAPRSATPWCN